MFELIIEIFERPELSVIAFVAPHDLLEPVDRLFVDVVSLRDTAKFYWKIAHYTMSAKLCLVL